MRICLVTPFAWSEPHEVNDHVAGVARRAAGARALGHRARAVEPRRPTSSPAAARCSASADAEVIAVGPAVPISRRSSMGVPVGVRANLTLALSRGGYDVVHGFEPGLPSLSYLALRDTHDDLGRELLLARAARATRPARRSASGCSAGSTRWSRPRPRPPRPRPSASPATTASSRPASTPRSSGPRRKRKLIVLEWRGVERPLARARDPDARRAAGLGARPAADEAALRPAVRAAPPRRPRARRGSRRDAAARASSSARPRSSSRPSRGARGSPRGRAAGAAIAAPPGVETQPELAAAAVARLAENDDLRSELGRRGARSAPRRRASPPSPPSSTALPQPRPPPPHRAPRRRPARRPRVDHVDLHMHTSLVARLLDPGRGPARPRRVDRARRDRDHRPQPLRRRARGGRARPQPQARP